MLTRGCRVDKVTKLCWDVSEGSNQTIPSKYRDELTYGCQINKYIDEFTNKCLGNIGFVDKQQPKSYRAELILVQ
jgi:hypothetical protein